MTDTKAMPARPVFRVLAAVFYLAIGLFIIEASLSLFYIYKTRSASEQQGRVIFMSTVRDGSANTLWRMPWQEYEPGTSKSMQLADGTRYTIEISKDGFRTRDIHPKPEGTIRILAIGASTTVQGESNETTYPAYLERFLAEAYPDTAFEVYNLGVSGTRTDYWLQRFDRLISFEPDLVIQYNAINDLTYSESLEAYYEEHIGLAFWRGRFLYQLLMPANPQEFAWVYGQMIDNMLELQHRLKARGVGYIAATFASPDPDSLSGDFAWFLNYNVATHWGRASKTLRYRDFHHMLDYFNRELVARMTDQQVTVVDVASQVTQGEDFIDACHMTDAGIQKQAHAFLPAVMASLPVFMN